MARTRRQMGQPTAVVQKDVTCGASDATNATSIIVPGDGAYVVGIVVTQKTAGTGTGSFTATLKNGSVAVADAVTVDADAVAGTYQGSGEGSREPLVEGAPLTLATVETGDVSGDAVLTISVIFGL